MIIIQITVIVILFNNKLDFYIAPLKLSHGTLDNKTNRYKYNNKTNKKNRLGYNILDNQEKANLKNQIRFDQMILVSFPEILFFKNIKEQNLTNTTFLSSCCVYFQYLYSAFYKCMVSAQWCKHS